MAEFCVYKYEFEQLRQRSILTRPGIEFSLGLSRAVLDGALKATGILEFWKKKRNGDLTKAPAHIVSYHDDVALLTVHNVVSVKRWKEMEDKPEEMDSFPHSRVIVDNRPGVQQIVIERSASFNGKPDLPLAMIERYFNRLLEEYDACVRIVGKVHVGDVWRRVESEVTNGHPVKKVEFVMGARDQVDVGVSENAELLLATAKWNSIVNAARTKLVTEAPSGKALLFAQAEEDCKNVVDLCARNGYEIIVHFEKSGIYKSSMKKHIAFFPMRDGDYTDFIEGVLDVTDGKYALIRWLDDIRRDDPNSFVYE